MHVRLAAVAGLLVLAGCSSPTPGMPKAVEPPAIDPSITVVKLDKRMEVGRDVWLTVENIEVDPECTRPNKRGPESEHFVALTISVEIGANYARELIDLTSTAFTIMGPTGLDTGRSGSTQWCFPDADYLHNSFEPNQRYRGKIIVDTVHAKGTLIYKRWRWDY